MRRSLIAALLCTTALAACGDGGGSEASAPMTATVRIADFKFKPATVTVEAGATLRFVNEDRASHTATAEGPFDTGGLRKGQSKNVTVSKAGTLAYRCDFHPFMTGSVVVK